MNAEYLKTTGSVLVIDKPLGWTSADVVRKVKFRLHKYYGNIKVGHAGTLDPLATGILLVCLGRATKRVEELQSSAKEYVAQIELGATTPSFDLEHPVDARYPTDHITRQAVEQALRDLSGERMQMPPVFSAKLIDGKRAYEYARKGDSVEMREAQINIYRIELIDYQMPSITIRVSCSKGTYIRSLAREIGEKLDSGAHLTALRRTVNGGYGIDEALSLDEALASIEPDGDCVAATEPESAHPKAVDQNTAQ